MLHHGRLLLLRASASLAFMTLTMAGWSDAAALDSAPTPVSPVVVNSAAEAAGPGPGLSASGANDYSATAADIANLPAGDSSALTDVLLQMPGVALDQNQQIHIRDTEGPQFQYQINRALVPLDINTNPPFLSMINPMFVKRIDLIDGVLPARFGDATGGVVDIQTKDGCEQPGGSVSVLFGQRGTLQPSAQYAGCAGRFSYYLSGLYDEGETAFSSATPGPNPIHDYTRQGQFFGQFSYALDEKTRLSLTLSAAASDNQLPNVPNLTPQFTLAGVNAFNSAAINSYLNFRDYLAILSLSGSPAPGVTYQLDYAAHSISQKFLPDNAGELIFQGVASTASHMDIDNTLQGDLNFATGRHTLGAGFYLGEYHVEVADSSLVFPVDADGNQSSSIPMQVSNGARATNVVTGLYVDDLWRVTDRLAANVGVRFDGLTGFTNHHQFDPTVNLTYDLGGGATLHGGFARYMQVPSFQGISPGAPAAFAGTTAAGPPGITNPLTEDDYEWDVGLVQRLGPHLTVSVDNFYERTDHYLDTGQFGVVPIFAPFNYDRGYIWGSEVAVKYRAGGLSTYANLTLGRNMQEGVATGQFNFDPAELAYIDTHYIVLDHQPLAGVSAGAAYAWELWSLSVDGLFSSGLRAGFADLEQLPHVFQVNAAVQRAFRIPGVGKLTNRLAILNLTDRVNLIRPAEGIGIFQAAYGPRFTVLDSVTLAF
jgi:hypothetical protein